VGGSPSVDLSHRTQSQLTLVLLAWALGWTFAVPMIVASFGVQDGSASRLAIPFLIAGAAIAGLGFPAWITARFDGSERPALEGAGWAAAFFVAMVLAHWNAIFPPPIPEFNINTTETIAARRAYRASGPHLPPVLLRFVSGLGLFGLAAGFISGFHSRQPRDPPVAHLVMAALFGIVLALALPVAAGATIIAVPIASHFASEGQTGAMESVTAIGTLVLGAGVVGALFGCVVIAARRLIVTGRRLPLAVSIAVVAVLGPAAPGGGAAAAQQTRPAFRSGVDLVALNVAVTTEAVRP
jgi:hypothetical protein